MKVTAPTVRKIARVALVGLESPTAAILSECFRQFGIAPEEMSTNEVERFQTEKFDACVLRLDDTAERVLSVARSAPANFRMVVYGITASTAQALRFSRFGINTLLDDPVDKREALRAVRATHLLVVHEFRRYVRVPLVTPVVIHFEGRHFDGSTQEVSAGGMSLDGSGISVPAGLIVQVEFTLPASLPVHVRASVRWGIKGTLGLRFDEYDPGRTQVKEWIDRYLGVV